MSADAPHLLTTTRRADSNHVKLWYSRSECHWVALHPFASKIAPLPLPVFPMTVFQNSLADALGTFQSLQALEPSLLRASEAVKSCLLSGGKLLVAGNGGSAADGADFATEYACRYKHDRKPFPAINLSACGSLLTATGNDYGYEATFSRQVEAFGKQGDVLVALTTSGNSPNILQALQTAKRLEIRTISLLGKDGGRARGLAEIELLVPSTVTARVQEAHKFLLHSICEHVEEALQEASKSAKTS